MTKPSDNAWMAYAKSLWGAHEYKVVVEKVRSLSPVVPVFDYKGASNIEEIKFKLAQRDMHALVMSILIPKGNENE
jgi:hypothetical protein